MAQWKTAVTPLLTHLTKIHLSCIINIFVDNLATQDARASAAKIVTKLAWYIWAYSRGQVNPSYIIHEKHFWWHCPMLLLRNPKCPPGKCTCIKVFVLLSTTHSSPFRDSILMWIHWHLLLLNFMVYHVFMYFMAFDITWIAKLFFSILSDSSFNWYQWQMAILSSKIYDVFWGLFYIFFFTSHRKPFFSMLCHSSFMWALPSNSPSCILWCTISHTQPGA